MITIKQAQIEDLKKVQKLNHRIMFRNKEFDPDIDINFDLTEKGADFFKVALTNPDGCFFLAYHKDKLVGYANGSKKEVYIFRKKKYFEVENIGVIPEYKGKGIGTKLLKTLLNWAKRKGFNRAYLNCYIKNKEALVFYKKHGFEKIDVSLEKDI
ncbi:MAG: GNAT family N-acetyltransferase [Candidatus Dojkabacteria bacterium]|jgi:GNAT superfamily N-acetyltransferase|nr:GNAT family N-acetyltransferase [Candidatus Dojkabacteria bacterium]